MDHVLLTSNVEKFHARWSSFVCEYAEFEHISDREHPFYDLGLSIPANTDLWQFAFITYNSARYNELKDRQFSVYICTKNFNIDTSNEILVCSKFGPLPEKIQSCTEVHNFFGSRVYRKYIVRMFIIIPKLDNRVVRFLSHAPLQFAFSMGELLCYHANHIGLVNRPSPAGCVPFEYTDIEAEESGYTEPAPSDSNELYGSKNLVINNYTYDCVLKGRQIFATEIWRKRMKVKDIKFNDDTPTVMWADGTNTIVNRQPESEDDIEKALGYAFMKKALSYEDNAKKRNVDKFIDKWKIKREEARVKALKKLEKKLMKKKLNEQKGEQEV